MRNHAAYHLSGEKSLSRKQIEILDMDEQRCPYCNSKKTVKAGVTKLRLQTVQRFLCKSCEKHFTEKKLKFKSYPAGIVLHVLSTYNLGYYMQQTKRILSSKFHLSLPLTTMHAWIKNYASICTFNRIREQALAEFKSEQMITQQKFFHHQLYLFQLHQAKLKILLSYPEHKKFSLLQEYLQKVYKRELPEHIFVYPDEELEKRASQVKAKLLEFTKLEKQNLANKLAELGLMLAKNNKERHQAIQNFMLLNDSTTIATEVPVYLTNDDISYFKGKGFTFDFENYRTPITGHIDVLQIRNGLIHILDYKPGAEKVNAINQLTIYALALVSRTKLAVKDFKCAWFDDKAYYEFFPLHAVYERR